MKSYSWLVIVGLIDAYTHYLKHHYSIQTNHYFVRALENCIVIRVLPLMLTVSCTLRTKLLRTPSF